MAGKGEGRARRLEWWVPAAYALVAGAWIYGSDTLVAAIAGSIEHQKAISVYKGFGFVVVTALLLHAGLRWALRRERADAQRIQEAHQFNEQIIRSAQEGVIVYGPDLCYQVWNPFMEQLSGRPADEVLGRHPREVFPFLLEAGLVDRLEKVLAGQSVDTIDFHYQDSPAGKAGWHTDTSAPLRNAQGEIIGVIGIVRDITGRKLAEDALRENRATLNLVLDTVPQSIFWKDRESRYLGCNRVFAAAAGLDDPAGIIGKTDFDLPWPRAEAEGYRADDQEVMLTNRPKLHIIERLSQADGQRLWVDTSKSPLRDGTGQPFGVLGIYEDITARKQEEAERRDLQAQLQQAQKMESLGSLAGGVAHDMNNVLGAILGLASIHVDAHPEGSPAHRAFQTIIKAAVRGGTMVKSLLSFARQSPAEQRELDLNALLAEEVHLLERTTLSRVRLELDLAPDLQPILGDAGALAHAFMNLCVNAVDAMPEGGRITFRTRNANAGWIEVQVEDTGTGMPKEVLARALDPFFTTKDTGKGTGLGLSMVYSTVTSHRGRITIESEPGRGTCVRMMFPTCEPAGQAPGTVESREPTLPRTALEILLVDDDELILTTMQALLRALGHNVTAVSNGEGAMDLIENGLQPDLVILDMNMPGMGGGETLSRLRALRPSLPVLLATGRADQTAMDLLEIHPFVTLMSKPFTIGELKKNLEAVGRP